MLDPLIIGLVGFVEAKQKKDVEEDAVVPSSTNHRWPEETQGCCRARVIGVESPKCRHSHHRLGVVGYLFSNH